MRITIALAGNPNSGKTTLFNDLTGSSQYVGNWPGVTVEKKEGRLKGHKDVVIQDLPGIYSLSPYTLEEVVARSYLVKERPDAILNIVDGTNIERNLYLTTQLAELGIPMIIALNMIDVTRKNGDQINLKKLGEALGCEVVETSALRGEGSREVARKAAQLAGKKAGEPPHVFAGSVEHALAHIEDLITHRDGQEAVHHHHADGSRHEGGIVPDHLARWYAIKLFERDEKVLEELSLPAGIRSAIESTIKDCEAEMDDDAESIITNQRYAYINRLVSTCVKKGRPKGALTTSDKIDRVVTNRWLALPIFVAVMALVYYIAVSSIGTIVTDFTNDVFVAEWIQEPVRGWLTGIGTAGWLTGLICDGIIAGVGAVIGFVPQMLVLFFLLSILEDVGYMSRVAFIMDRIFRRFGLSGKSFIPILVGIGCGVPGVMASRTIENERDRRMTIMTTCFIPCGAKMPIIGLIAGALFGGSSWVATSAYFIGFAAIIISGIILKKTKLFAGDPAPFVMELPAYRLPTARNIMLHMWSKAKDFLYKAFTVIFVASIVIWLLQSFDTRFYMVDNPENSMLAGIGSFIAPFFAPLGFGDWRAATALVTGLTAKEVVISTLSVLMGGDGDIPGTALQSIFTPLTALSFLTFSLLYPPCIAALAAIRREMNSTTETFYIMSYQIITSWIVAFIVYNLGKILGFK